MNDREVEQYFDGTTHYWEKDSFQNKRIGAKSRLAAFLYCQKIAGDTFSIGEIREAFDINNSENLTRRLRELRELGWVFEGYKANSSLSPTEYLIVEKGWHPLQGKKTKERSISQKTRRKVFERDGLRCQVCGIKSGEKYSEKKGDTARLTIGHKQAVACGGLDDESNLRTECGKCNEPVRESVSYVPVATVLELLSDISDAEKSQFIECLTDVEKLRKINYLSHVVTSLKNEDREIFDAWIVSS